MKGSVVKKILFVDDMPERFDRFISIRQDDVEAVWASDPDGACRSLLLMGEFDEVWLDHDAGEGLPGEKLTFYPVACVLAAMRFKGKVFLHSGNPVGVERMAAILKDCGIMATRPDGHTLAGVHGGREPGDGSQGYV